MASLPPLIPREILFGNPVKTSPEISPDGLHLSYVAPLNGVLNVFVGEIGEDPDAFRPVTRDTERGVRQYFWSQDGREILYLQDAGGNENWRLYAASASAFGGDSPPARDLTPFDDVQTHVIATHKDHPDEMLVALNRDDARLHDAYHLRISTGELTKIASNPGNFIDWFVDADFQLRAAGVMLENGSSQLVLKDDAAEGGWRVVKEWSVDDALGSRAAGFNKAGDAMYIVDSTGANVGRLKLMELASGAETFIYEDPDHTYDIGGVVLHPDSRQLQAVRMNREKVEWQFFDDGMKADVERLSSVQPGEISIVGRDRDDKVWLVAFSGDTSTTLYYVYDRASGATKFFFSTQPALDDYTLAPMQPVAFASRDGMTLHGYLSTPVGSEPKNLPMVLFVHGGPWARDSWGLNATHQWLANRGYAVLSVNYRGSTGYGKEFLNAGNREWGAKMHDDLVDSVHWAVDQGVADEKKAAIYGGSYGGYAALVGATFTPELFACAVDVVGPSNLVTLITSIPPYWQIVRSQFTLRVGDPETEVEFLESRSPLFKVDQIKIPMLIAQGANDPRVKLAESDQIVEAMQRHGIPHEYLVFPDEGHGFVRPENRLKFQAAAEKFLAQHLGGRFEESAEVAN